MKHWPSSFPRVAGFAPAAGHCAVSAGLRLRVNDADAAPSHRIHGALDRLPMVERSGIPLQLSRLDAPLDPAAHPAIRAEAYELRIETHGITLAAEDEAGWFYGIHTLRQLIAAHADDDGLPCGVIRDQPRFRWRGSMIDSARHFQPVEWLLRHLDRMASLKLNRFHWHLTDDEAWRAQIKRFPRLTQEAAWRGIGAHRHGGFYTQDDMRRVVKYARDRFITVIPEVDMPGHCNAALVAFPELSCTGEPLPLATQGWNAFTSLAGRRAFCAGNGAVYPFIEGVLTELRDVFDPPYLHIGGDETPHAHWKECPRCQAMLRKIGSDDLAALRVHFLNRIDAFCRDTLGVPTISWTEGVSDRMPRDQIVHAWFPGEAATAARLGYDTLNSNHEWTYLDYPPSTALAAHKPAWMIVLPLEKIYHFDPLPDGLEERYADRVLGSEAPLWTEHAPDPAALEAQLMPRLVAFAEALWSPRLGRDFDEFRRRLREHQRLGTLDLGMPDPAEPVAVG